MAASVPVDDGRMRHYSGEKGDAGRTKTQVAPVGGRVRWGGPHQEADRRRDRFRAGRGPEARRLVGEQDTGAGGWAPSPRAAAAPARHSAELRLQAGRPHTRQRRLPIGWRRSVTVASVATHATIGSRIMRRAAAWAAMMTHARADEMCLFFLVSTRNWSHMPVGGVVCPDRRCGRSGGADPRHRRASSRRRLQYLLGGWRFRAGARRLPDAPPPASPAPLPAAAAHLPVPAAALTSAPHTRPLAPGLRLVPSTSHSSPHSCSTLEGPFLSRPPPSLRLSPPPPPPSLSSRPAATSPPSLLPAASTPWRPPRTTPPP